MRLFIVIGLMTCLTACRQEMAEQPSYRPLRPSRYFADGRSGRPPVDGTIARGTKPASGRTSPDWPRIAGILGVIPADPLAAASQTAEWSLYRDSIPMP